MQDYKVGDMVWFYPYSPVPNTTLKLGIILDCLLLPGSADVFYYKIIRPRNCQRLLPVEICAASEIRSVNG